MSKGTGALILLLSMLTGLALADEATPYWHDGAGEYRNGLSVSAVRASPDGTVLYTLDRRFIRKWDLATGKSLSCAQVPGSTGGLALSLDGKLVALTAEDGVLLLLSVDLTIRNRYPILDDSPTAVSFSPTGLLCGTALGTLREFNPADGTCKTVESGWKQSVRAIEVDPAGNIAVSFAESIWIRARGKARGWSKVFRHARADGCHIVTSGKSAYVAVISSSSLSYFDIETGEAKGRVECPARILDSAASGSFLAFSMADSSVRTYDYSTGLAEESNWSSSSNLARILLVGDKIAGFDPDGSLRVFTRKGELTAGPVGKSGPVLCMATGRLREGAMWLAIGRSTAISFFELSAEVEPKPLFSLMHAVTVVRDAGIGRALCVLPAGRAAEIDVLTGKTIRKLELDEASKVVAAGRNANGSLLLRTDGVLIRWSDSSEQGTPPETTTLPPQYRYFGLSRDAQYAFCYSNSGEILGLKLADNSLVTLAPALDGDGIRTPTAVAVEGNRVAVARRGISEIYSLESPGKPVKSFVSGKAESSLAFLGSDRLAVAFDDGIVKIFSDGETKSYVLHRPVSYLVTVGRMLGVGFFDSQAALIEVEEQPK